MLQEIHITSVNDGQWKVKTKNVKAKELDLAIATLFCLYMGQLNKEQRREAMLELLDSLMKGMRRIYDI